MPMKQNYPSSLLLYILNESTEEYRDTVDQACIHSPKIKATVEQMQHDVRIAKSADCEPPKHCMDHIMAALQEEVYA